MTDIFYNSQSVLLADAAALIQHGCHKAALILLLKGFSVNPKGALFQPLADVCRLQNDWNTLDLICRQRQISCASDPLSWFHLAGCYLFKRKYLDAIGCLRKALSSSPDYFEAWLELGNIWKELGEVKRSIVCYRHAARFAPECARIYDNLLFAQIFSDAYTPEQLALAHKEWGACSKPATIDTDIPFVSTSQKLRVGYISSDLREHSVTNFLEPLLRQHNHQQFEIFCYQCNQDTDSVTEKLKEYADHWRDIANLSDAETYKIIKEDQLHILVELGGHTAGNRLPLLMRSPAPVQVTWLGYPHSTGLPSIRYRITDELVDPPGEADNWHTEKLVRIPAPFICYSPPQKVPSTVQLPPSVQSGVVTFVCFNRIDKISSSLLDVWRVLLERLPQARLMLKSSVFSDGWARNRFVSRSKLPQDRLILLERTPDRISHLSMYNYADIALDTSPYNGTTTTCEALLMGVPVITLAGRHHASRVGKTLLESVGLRALVVDTPEAYLERACTLAQDLALMSNTRQTLRQAVLASSLCDAENFAKKMEMAYRSMVSSPSV